MDNYTKYLSDAEQAGVNPLTKREWTREGGLTLQQSLALSRRYHQATRRRERENEEIVNNGK